MSIQNSQNDQMKTFSDEDRKFVLDFIDMFSAIKGKPLKIFFNKNTKRHFITFDSRKNEYQIFTDPLDSNFDSWKTPIEHEICHFLFDTKFTTFKKHVDKIINESNCPEDLKRISAKVIHTIYNVIEDQRIESWFSEYKKGFEKRITNARKSLGLNPEIVNENKLQNPISVLLASRFFRNDLVRKSNFPLCENYINEAEQLNPKGSILLVKKFYDKIMLPYLIKQKERDQENKKQKENQSQQNQKSDQADQEEDQKGKDKQKSQTEKSENSEEEKEEDKDQSLDQLENDLDKENNSDLEDQDQEEEDSEEEDSEEEDSDSNSNSDSEEDSEEEDSDSNSNSNSDSEEEDSEEEDSDSNSNSNSDSEEDSEEEDSDSNSNSNSDSEEEDSEEEDSEEEDSDSDSNSNSNSEEKDSEEDSDSNSNSDSEEEEDSDSNSNSDSEEEEDSDSDPEKELKDLEELSDKLNEESDHKDFEEDPKDRKQSIDFNDLENQLAKSKTDAKNDFKKLKEKLLDIENNPSTRLKEFDDLINRSYTRNDITNDVDNNEFDFNNSLANKLTRAFDIVKGSRKTILEEQGIALNINQYVNGLANSDPRVFKSETKQTGLNIYIIHDMSYSMSNKDTINEIEMTRSQIATNTISTMFKAIKKYPQIKLKVRGFSGIQNFRSGKEKYFSEFDSVRVDKINQVGKLNNCLGGTMLDLALIDLEKEMKKDHGKKFVIVLTDGMPDSLHEERYNYFNYLLKKLFTKKQIGVFGILIGDEIDFMKNVFGKNFAVGNSEEAEKNLIKVFTKTIKENLI